jgi:prephenate dehydrogenase
MSAHHIDTVAVLGASGEMGGVFATFCRAAGHTVRELGRPLTAEKLAAGLAGADLVLLCVPIGAMRETLAAVAPHLTGDQILADACSVKSIPVEQMLKAYAGPVVGTHPMFGGNLPERSERRVAVTPGRDDRGRARQRLARGASGFSPFATTAEEHDRTKALIRGSTS